jgi:hypothetical protein
VLLLIVPVRLSAFARDRLRLLERKPLTLIAGLRSILTTVVVSGYGFDSFGKVMFGSAGAASSDAARAVCLYVRQRQPTKCDVLYDFRVLWRSPRFC